MGAILYIFAGSYVRLMQSMIESPDSAYFGQIPLGTLINVDLPWNPSRLE